MSNIPRVKRVEFTIASIGCKGNPSLIPSAALSKSSTVGPSKGISIYYPKGSVHSSYSKTQFAKDSLWLSFLNEYA
jgi:hypothetical protein